MIRITRAVQIYEVDLGWGVFDQPADGSVEVPEHATWAPGERPYYTWIETAHHTEKDCPTCSSAKDCLQKVSLWPDTGTVEVVHDYENREAN